MILIDEILHQYGQQIVTQLKADIEKKEITPFGPVNATGKLRDSIRYEVSNGTLSVYALGYAYFLEHGRQPGKRPPTLAIKQWMQAKGISSNTIKPDSLAYLIARKIGKQGTMLYKQGGSHLLSGLLNTQLINGLKSELLGHIHAQVVKIIHNGATNTST